jgi:hypothetical protein
MDRFDILAKYRHRSAHDRRALRRRTGAIAALALIVASGLVATAFFVSNAGRAEHAAASQPAVTGYPAVISHIKDAPDLRAGETGLGRAGAWHQYEPLY